MSKPSAFSLRPRSRWWRRVGYLSAIPAVFGSLSLATAWSNLGAPPEENRRQAFERSPHFDRDSGRFFNDLEVVDPPFWPVLREWIRGAPDTAPETSPPVFSGTRQVLEQPVPDGLRVTWLGHSTMLVEIDGARILTDPVWGPRAAPWSFMGPARFHEPPLAIEDLPKIDAVVLSHDHYDHLDAPTIRELATRIPRFLVPLGLGAHLESWGVPKENIEELDWWEEREIGGVRLISTPARHFSGRSLSDRNRTLWSSWSMVGPRNRAFFSGDTGMFPGFAEIGERLGPFDLTMVESGAYNRLWADVHLGPEQALQAHLDLRGKTMMPVHWGTFDLALHAWTEPVERLLVAAEDNDARVVIPQPGESVVPSRDAAVRRWWPELNWRTAAADPIVSSGL